MAAGISEGIERSTHRVCNDSFSRVLNREGRRARSDECANGGIDTFEKDRALHLVVVAGVQSGGGEDLLESPGLGKGEHATVLHALERARGEKGKQGLEHLGDTGFGNTAGNDHRDLAT